MAKPRTPSKATRLRLQLKQERKPVYCRKCLERVWQGKVDGKWGLVGEDGSKHFCKITLDINPY